MMKKLTTTLLSTATLSSVVLAGEFSDAVPTPAPVPVPSPKVDSKLPGLPDFLKFSADVRLRYEARDQGDLDYSHALTLRVRPGFTLFPDEALSFFVETEHTVALVDDFQVGTPASAVFTPFQANNTPIADPETNELNRLFASYKVGAFSAKVGRQRVIFDNAAFIGNVGWRQNEQTFDAARIDYAKDGLKATYAYVNEVNRIFGSDAPGFGRELLGDAHLVNVSYTKDDFKVAGYGYFLDFSDLGDFASSNTYGGFVDFNAGGKVHLEAAVQTESGDQDDYTALYGHATYTKKVGTVSFTAGAEYLGRDFITPLATVHAFNGWADAFIGERLGLTNNLDGLSDFHVKAATKLSNGIALKAAVHHFRDDTLSESYGWEGNLVAVKAINPNTKVLAKLSYFLADDDAPAAISSDIEQFSLQLDYSF